MRITSVYTTPDGDSAFQEIDISGITLSASGIVIVEPSTTLTSRPNQFHAAFACRQSSLPVVRTNSKNSGSGRR